MNDSSPSVRVPTRRVNWRSTGRWPRVFAILVSVIWVTGSPLQAQRTAPGTVLGTVTDAATGEPLSAVQVTSRLEGHTEGSAGTITGANGRFLIAALRAGRYEITFSRIGFTAQTRQVTIGEDADGSLELGTISLTQAAVELEGVEVTAERPAVVHEADRDVYSADAIAGAAGGSATDVLQGIPDLEVDINGTVTMFGQSPAIYINGREAPMTGEALALFLEQFAAENIESVEVMPNPSARYDAEGSGGIVNIVLKKGAGLGLSGNAFVNAGSQGQLRGGGRATYQRGPLTLNGGASLGLSRDERTSTELRQNLLADPITFLGQDGVTDRSSWSGNIDLGADYVVSEATELTAEARIDRNTFTVDRITRFTEMDAEQDVTGAYDLILLDDGTGRSMDFALEVEHQLGAASGNGGRGARMARGGRGGGRGPYRQRDDALSVELEYETGDDLEQGMVERRVLEELGVVDYADALTWEEDRETESELAVGFDLARGIGPSTRMELGYEGEFGSTEEGRVEELRGTDPTGSPISTERGGFVHRQVVHGAYLTLTRSFGDLGVQLGARGEHADSRLELPGDDGVHGNDYFGIFPSANLNYSFGGGIRARLSYSVRVQRPSSNVLNPIDKSSDPLNRRVGNPTIEPQYTHSYMLNASWSGDVGYLRATPFVRRSLNEWEEIRTVDGQGLSTTTYENLGSTDSYGISLTGGVRDFHGIGARLSLNGQHTDRHYVAVLERTPPSSTRWSVRGNLDGEVASGLTAQGSVVYNPPRDLPQGRASSTVMTRLGMRYRFLDRRASLNVGVTDPFDIYDSSIERRSRGFVETGTERVSMRRLNLSLSYSFQSGGGGGGGGRGPRGR